MIQLIQNTLCRIVCQLPWESHVAQHIKILTLAFYQVQNWVQTLVTVSKTMQADHPDFLNSNLTPYMCSLNTLRGKPENKILHTVDCDTKVHIPFQQLHHRFAYVPFLNYGTILPWNFDYLIIYPHSARNLKFTSLHQDIRSLGFKNV